jgi:hypothetical protein
MKFEILIAGTLAAVSAIAQDQVRVVTDANARPLTVDIVGSPSAMSITGRSVKGLPYAAEAVNETSRSLPDGNRISRKSTSAVYRDSQGRTRNELAMPAVGPWASGKGEKIVNIFDPVAKLSIMLHPDKTANKHEIPVMEGMNWTETVSGGGNARTMVFSRRAEGTKEINGEKKQVIEDVVIERMQGPEFDLPVPAPNVRMRTGASIAVAGVAGERPFRVQSDRNLRKEALGKKVIEGVEAEGTRTVSIIPAGEIGNERDIEIVDETWYSKEIEALVYSRHSDPQTGETTYRLTNIQRGEQPIHLFEVPADYKVIDNGPRRIEFKMRNNQ